MTVAAGRAAGSSHEARRVLARLVGFSAAVTVVLAVLGLVATTALQNDAAASDLRAGILEANEARSSLVGGVESIAAIVEADAALGRAQDALREAADARSVLPLAFVWGLCAASAVAVWVACAYLYASVIRPFSRLESFADSVAQGELDLPLTYERSNPFGRFTWAFDNMRKEIKRARAAEAQAIEQSKTAIAALSHDIKTPIASIRAYSEALELGLAGTDAERADYAQVIARKCDEVTQLTDDLFLHALADLDRIAVACEASPVHEVVKRAVADFDATGEVRLGHVDEAVASIDGKRLAQVLENLFANARKYAPGSPIVVEGRRGKGAYRIIVRDFGPGIPPEDLPFVFDRFYRGANRGDAPGAGLGLFIVRYLVEQMHGAVRLENVDPGLEVVLELPLES